MFRTTAASPSARPSKRRAALASSALAAASALAACQGGTSPTAGARARETAEPVLAAPAPPACSADVCRDDATLVACAGGAPAPKSCDPKEACLGRACVDLSTAGAPVERARLDGVGAEGWINAWSAVTPLPKKLADAYLADGDPAPLGGPKAFKAVCAPDGYVVPRPKDVDKGFGQVISVLTTIVWSSEPRKVVLATGVSGKLSVAVAGAPVVVDQPEAKGIGKRAWPDERAAPIDLAKGATRITVVLEAPSTSERVGGFYLRLRTPDGGVPEGLAVSEPFAEAACSPGELLETNARIEAHESGLALTMAPRWRGLTPMEKKPALAIATGGKAGARIDVAFDRATGSFPLAIDGAADVTLADGDRVLFEEKLPAYGALAGRIGKLVDSVARAKTSAIPEASRASYEAHVASVAALVAKGDDDLPYLERQTKILESLLEGIDRGEDPYAGLTGFVYRAYRSPLDGSLQPYVAFVPPSQKKGKEQPLVVVSHGRNRSPVLALRTLVGAAPDDHMTLQFAARNLPGFMDQRALLVAPLGYDEGASHPLGEEDVLRVIDEMAAAYHVDRRRVSLTGYSLGGTVAFVLPLHYPDVFSAAAPLCGYPNLMAYASVTGAKQKAAWEEAMLAKKYIVNYAENGLHVPMQVVHGGKDAPERSQVVVDRYRSLGYSIIFDVQDDLDHDVWDYAYKDSQMVPWLTHFERPASPKHVRLSTGEYRYDRAYWVKLLLMKDSASPELAKVDARASDKDRRLTLTTSNVAALEIDRAALEPKDAFDGPITVVADGTELPVGAGEGPIDLANANGWSIASAPPSLAGTKHHGVSGPIGDVLHHPLVVVYGTTNPAHAVVNRMVAEELASAGLGPDVEYLVTARFPVVSDVEATDDVLRKKSVVLVGSPADNALTARFAKDLPIQFDGDAVVVHGQRYAGKGVGVSFVAPRPDDPDEYVVVHAGLDVDGTLASRSLPRYLPDWVVYDDKVGVERGGLLFGSRPTLAGGFFDEHWH